MAQARPRANTVVVDAKAEAVRLDDPLNRPRAVDEGDRPHILFLSVMPKVWRVVPVDKDGQPQRLAPSEFIGPLDHSHRVPPLVICAQGLELLAEIALPLGARILGCTR
ncbi:MAG: hypothetical protein ACR2GC_01380 [Methyloceanibacter sp.]|uniref:hypothetical protein n=1 Tax=Methyloceanibacter sp. TaxID=1965321 RepID=UPI003D9BC834